MSLVTLETTKEAQEFMKLLEPITFAVVVNIGGTADAERKNWLWYKTGKPISFPIPWLQAYPLDLLYYDCLAFNIIPPGFINVPCFEPGSNFACQKIEK